MIVTPPNPPGSCLMENPITHEEWPWFCNGWINPEPGAAQREGDGKGDQFSVKMLHIWDGPGADNQYLCSVAFQSINSTLSVYFVCRLQGRCEISLSFSSLSIMTVFIKLLLCLMPHSTAEGNQKRPHWLLPYKRENRHEQARTKRKALAMLERDHVSCPTPSTESWTPSPPVTTRQIGPEEAQRQSEHATRPQLLVL